MKAEVVENARSSVSSSTHRRSEDEVMKHKADDIDESGGVGVGGFEDTEKKSVEHEPHYEAFPVERQQTVQFSEEHQRASALSRIITGRSASSYAPSPGPPPDGGLRAWLMVLMTVFVMFNSWGYIQTFGVFQTYYLTVLGESESTISWIGSVQIFLLFSVGPISGRLTDAGYFRPVLVFGLFMQLLGIFMTSISRKYWHVFLAQGLCQGIGNGCQFTPVMGVISTYFDKKRSLAIGITASGAAVGGMVMPAMVQQLLPQIGYAWTVRCLGLVVAVLGISACTVLQTRVPPRAAGPWVEWAAFKEPTFLLFCIGMFLSFWGVYFPFYYVGSFVRTIQHGSFTTSISVLLLMNGVSIPGRLVPAFIADLWVGPINCMMFAALSTGIVTFCWASVDSSRAGLWVFAGFFGFLAAGIQSLFPACLASLVPDLQKRGARMGMGFFVAGVASLTGTPIAGALIAADGGNYLYAQMWAGGSLVLGSILLGLSRYAKVGMKLKARY